MNTIRLSPYLAFNGNCREAMEFYQSVLGGELEVSTFRDFASTQTPQEYQDNIMHSTLKSDTLELMASDGAPGTPVIFGDSVSISLAGKDEAQLTTFFNGLSAGGTITMPLEKQVWGDKFGMCTDKFGIHWMVNISSGSPAAT